MFSTEGQDGELHELSIADRVLNLQKKLGAKAQASPEFRFYALIDKVHQVLQDVAKNHPDVCTTPEPRVRFRAFGNSSLDHELLCWVEKPVLRGRVLHRLNTEVYKQFQNNSIEIPFPQRDVHIRSNPTQELSGDTGSID